MKKLVGMIVVTLFMVALLAAPVGAKTGSIKVDSDNVCDDINTEDNTIVAGSTVYIWLNSKKVSGTYEYAIYNNGEMIVPLTEITFYQCSAGSTLGDKYWVAEITAPDGTGLTLPESLTLTVYGLGGTISSDSFTLIGPS